VVDPARMRFLVGNSIHRSLPCQIPVTPEESLLELNPSMSLQQVARLQCLFRTPVSSTQTKMKFDSHQLHQWMPADVALAEEYTIDPMTIPDMNLVPIKKRDHLRIDLRPVAFRAVPSQEEDPLTVHRRNWEPLIETVPSFHQHAVCPTTPKSHCRMPLESAGDVRVITSLRFYYFQTRKTSPKQRILAEQVIYD
jgi:hypothetical protein